MKLVNLAKSHQKI